MASGWFLASDASSVAASRAAWSSCMIFLCSELPTPPRYALCALLRTSGTRAGLCPLRLLRGCLQGSWWLLVELPLNPFHPAALLLKLRPQSRLEYSLLVWPLGELANAVCRRGSRQAF